MELALLIVGNESHPQQAAGYRRSRGKGGAASCAELPYPSEIQKSFRSKSKICQWEQNLPENIRDAPYKSIVFSSEESVAKRKVFASRVVQKR